MLDLILEGDTTAITTALIVRAMVIFTAWIMMILACFVDFWSGVSTAKALGQKLNSHGFRKTMDKIGDYFKVAFVGLMVDIMGSIFAWYDLPYITILFCIATIIIEGKSVLENSRRKKANAGQIPDIIKQIMAAATHEDAVKVFKQVGAIVDAVNKSEKWEASENGEC